MSTEAKINTAIRALVRLPASAVCAVRRQADREEFARIDASVARLEDGLPDVGHALMSRQPVRDIPRRDPDDPLERLWNLQARQPETAGGR